MSSEMEDYIFYFIVLSLLASAFFSGMELAYLSSNRLKIELQIQKNGFRSVLLKILYKKESTIIAMILLGNNVALVTYGISMAEVLNPILAGWGIKGEFWILLNQTILSTILVLVTAEFLPKAIVQLNPNWFLSIGLIPLFFCYFIMFLPTQIVVLLTNSLLVFGGRASKINEKVFSKVDLEYYVKDISSRIKSGGKHGNEMFILKNALEFSRIKARDCMIPRTEIIAVELEESVDLVKKLFIEKGLSKIIVFREDIDNIIGYVHSFDFFRSPERLGQILKPISFVPTVISGKELLEKFNKQAGNVAVVTDEYGGTAGIVTLEDVIEEIFGEIVDEYDKLELVEQLVSDNEFLFSARIEIDYLNETYGLNIPESEDYDTLAGFILHTLAYIPKSNEQLDVNRLSLIIEEVSDRKIKLVRIRKN
ncbi:MAG: HlyC/CorC family transporter [Bacteroidetes bacterium]|nr:HlyC/CorC family transporter [Bacteroidota bacterium]